MTGLCIMRAAKDSFGRLVASEVNEPTINVREGDILDGRYRIERRLGRGGMGVVWAAQHVLLNTRVAIKFLLPEILQDPDAVRRFIREARAAAAIKSEHVARVFDVAMLDNGYPFQVIEFLEGGDLRGYLKQNGPLEATQAVDFVLQICDAIAEAHAIGVVHRDLKPENLFCTQGKDRRPCIKVLDFGISKLLQASLLNDGTHSTAMTRAGLILGSPQYMSPEQLQSAREVDARTDIWSLGIILFELLTGRVPFNGASLPELAINIANEATPSIRSFQPELRQELDAIVQRCLRKDREERYRDIAELAAALHPFAAVTAGPHIEQASPSANPDDQAISTLLPTSSVGQQSVGTAPASADALAPLSPSSLVSGVQSASSDTSRSMAARVSVPLRQKRKARWAFAWFLVALLGLASLVVHFARRAPALATTASSKAPVPVNVSSAVASSSSTIEPIVSADINKGSTESTPDNPSRSHVARVVHSTSPKRDNPAASMPANSATRPSPSARPSPVPGLNEENPYR
jgi:eukaryotic-like serine/threonine-protein kinase